jgi:hypothetical protein
VGGTGPPDSDAVRGVDEGAHASMNAEHMTNPPKTVGTRKRSGAAGMLRVSWVMVGVA